MARDTCKSILDTLLVTVQPPIKLPDGFNSSAQSMSKAAADAIPIIFGWTKIKENSHLDKLFMSVFSRCSDGISNFLSIPENVANRETRYQFMLNWIILLAFHCVNDGNNPNNLKYENIRELINNIYDSFLNWMLRDEDTFRGMFDKGRFPTYEKSAKTYSERISKNIESGINKDPTLRPLRTEIIKKLCELGGRIIPPTAPTKPNLNPRITIRAKQKKQQALPADAVEESKQPELYYDSGSDIEVDESELSAIKEINDNSNYKEDNSKYKVLIPPLDLTSLNREEPPQIQSDRPSIKYGTVADSKQFKFDGSRNPSTARSYASVAKGNPMNMRHPRSDLPGNHEFLRDKSPPPAPTVNSQMDQPIPPTSNMVRPAGVRVLTQRKLNPITQGTKQGGKNRTRKHKRHSKTNNHKTRRIVTTKPENHKYTRKHRNRT